MTTTELFDKYGKSTLDETIACAKRITRKIEGNTVGSKQTVRKHYVKYAGYLYDPVNMSPVDERYRSWTLREVDKPVFDMYLQFLQTKKEHFRINAERLINA